MASGTREKRTRETVYKREIDPEDNSEERALRVPSQRVPHREL
jgi:hypothetical protein